MHNWPRIEILNLHDYLEDWELHGLREWGYRRLLTGIIQGLNTPYSFADPIPWYISGQLAKPVSDFYQRPLKSLFGVVNYFEKGIELPMHFDESHPAVTVSFLTALKGQKEFPLVTRFADGQSYNFNPRPDNTAVLAETSRLLHGRAGVFEGEFAVSLAARFVDTAWQLNIINGNSWELDRKKAWTRRQEKRQQGAEILYKLYAEPFAFIKKADGHIRELMAALLSELKMTAALQDATVTEAGIVDSSIRKTALSWIKPEKYPNVLKYFVDVVKEALPYVAPQIEKAEDLIFPSYQYTVYKEGDFYRRHQDGGFDSFTNRSVSITVLLQDAEIGGEFQIENWPNGETVKLSAGDMVVFPSYKHHNVKEVKKGERHSLVCWLEKKEEEKEDASTG